MSIARVVAEWDHEAHVWVATSNDIPGLVAEAESEEELLTQLHTLIPELLELNAHLMRPLATSDSFNVHWLKDQQVAYA